MNNGPELAKIFRRTLGLKSGPVAVSIIENLNEAPVVFKKPDNPLPGICFAVMEAFRGKSLLIGKGDISCPMGLTALGLKGESGKLTRRQTVQAGIFGTEEAAQKYFAKGSYIPPGKSRAVAFTPLEKAVLEVDVCLFKINSEQAKWLLMASQYWDGFRHNLTVGSGYQGVCGDAIAYPYLSRKINLTLNGVGDRIGRTSGKNELFMGVPGDRIEGIARNLKEIYHKPIFKQYQSAKIQTRSSSARNHSGS
jgi:uncharacterized protein (DUF169 family)